MSARRAIVAAGVVLVVLVAVLAWKARGGGESREAAPATTAVTPAAAPVATAPVATAPPVMPAAKPAIDDDHAARPQPVPLPAGETPPPLDGKKCEPAPPQKAFT